MKRFPCFLLILLAGSSSPASDEVPTILCPVSDRPVKKTISLSYQGGKVYFSSEQARKQFDPEKAEFSTKANMQLVVTGQAVQTACPVTGEKLQPNLTLEIRGLKVGFCCIGCLGKVNDEKQEDIRLFYLFGNNAFRNGFAVRKPK